MSLSCRLEGLKRTRVWLVCLALSAAALAGNPARAEQPWRAKGPATSFVADWSAADRTDAEATAFFLKNVWPAVRDASRSLHARLKQPLPAVYAGPLSEAEQAAGVACFGLRAEQVLPWYAVPAAKQVAQRSFSIVAARGASEPVCVAVHALRDVRAVSVRCGELAGPGRIPASAVTSRLSLSYTMEPRGRGNIDTRQMLLLKVDGWDIPKGHTYEWVIDVHVPADAPGGQYKGQIEVTVAGKPAAVFELALEVLPVVLTDNGCRWGAFMTPNPAHATAAWCDLNARYGFNTLAWWNLDAPPLNWTWRGCKREESVLAKLRYANEELLSSQDFARLPEWVKARWDGTFLTFRLEEVEGLPRDHAARAAFYKKPMKLKAALGEIPPEQAQWICYDRPGMISNFDGEAIQSVELLDDAALAAFDGGMKRLKEHGFAGPITWFGAGGPTVPWEVRVVAQRLGPKYSRAGWKWRREVTPENSNHTWYLANAAIAKTFDRARTHRGWAEVVWCPCDESFQYRGVSGRSVPNMMGEMMPYIRHFAPGFRVYTVVWHKEHNWNGIWQCAVLQRDAKDAQGRDSSVYGPYHVICTNCPNDEDRQITWAAGGEYWVYTFVTSTVGSFTGNRLAMGFNGARHYAAVVYNFADSSGPSNPAPGEDLGKSIWITGQYTTNYYLARDGEKASRIDYALASHAALACRAGVLDRKYLETLRLLAHEKSSPEDIAFVEGIGEVIDRLGSAGRGGVDDFTAEVTDESGPQKLRRQIAERLKALLAR